MLFVFYIRARAHTHTHTHTHTQNSAAILSHDTHPRGVVEQLTATRKHSLQCLLCYKQQFSRSAVAGSWSQLQQNTEEEEEEVVVAVVAVVAAAAAAASVNHCTAGCLAQRGGQEDSATETPSESPCSRPGEEDRRKTHAIRLFCPPAKNRQKTTRRTKKKKKSRAAHRRTTA